MSDESAEPSGMPWDPASERVLASLVDMVPDTLRQLARATAREEAELAAQDRGAPAVDPTDVIRGWIRTTPPEQRDGLVEVIDALGFEPETFADDLQSVEGWGEGEGGEPAY